jgi:hypothetical protein
MGVVAIDLAAIGFDASIEIGDRWWCAGAWQRSGRPASARGGSGKECSGGSNLECSLW